MTVCGGTSPVQPREGVPGSQNEQGRVLHVAGDHASMPRGSGGKRGHPRRPAPEGGGSASPTSSRDRCGAQRKGKGLGKFCSPRK
jgi:hypothetical protein